MRVKGSFKLLGIQDIQGKKDTTKVYHNIALLQGIDSVKIFASDKQVELFKGINQMDTIECELDINIGSDRSYVGIVAVKKLSA